MSKSRRERAMGAIEKWPKAKKIVAVTFEDGITIRVDDDAKLLGYLKSLEDERANVLLDFAVKGFVTTDLVRMINRARAAHLSSEDERRDLTDLVRAMHRSLVRMNASARASKPRKHVEKAELISFRGHFQMNHNGKTRGWKRAAERHFRITSKTLNNRLGE